MICSAPDCNKTTEKYREYCQAHRMRLRRTGSLGTKPVKPVAPKNTEWYGTFLYVGWTVTETGCWHWNGSKFPNGYGQIKINGQPQGVHRVSYRYFNGNLPAGMLVLHSCDNKVCVNPEHLRVGTHQENMADRNERHPYFNGTLSARSRARNSSREDGK